MLVLDEGDDVVHATLDDRRGDADKGNAHHGSLPVVLGFHLGHRDFETVGHPAQE